MADILSYQGNPGLAFGSGSDNGIGQVGVYDFSPIVASLQGLAKRRNDVADQEYKQKISDRDTLFRKLATMEVALDKALPEQRGLLKSKISDIEKIYLDNPDILSNPEAYVKMQGALRDFNELDSYAKTNYATTTKDLLEAAKIADPDDRQKRLDHIQGWRDKLKENPYELYSPFQKELAMDYKAMAPEVPLTKKTIKEGANFQDEILNYTDPKEIIKNYRTNVLEAPDRSVANMYDELFNSYGLKSPEERGRDFQAYNKQIEKANKYLAEDEKLKPIVFDEQTGQIDLDKTSKDDFNRAVYVGMRFHEAQGTEFNKGRADAAKTGASIKKDAAYANAALIKANTDKLYKGVLGAAARDKAGAYVRKMAQSVNAAKTQEEADAILDEAYTRNLVNQPALIEGIGNNRVVAARIKPQNSLPLYTIKGANGPEQLIPINGVPVYDKYKDDKKKVPAAGAKITHYDGGYFEPVYMYKGQQLAISDMLKAYDGFKQKYGWSGSMNQWVKKVVDEKTYEVLIKGANGTTDRKLSLAAQRIIANKNTKKGQDGIFEPPADEAAEVSSTDPE